MQIMGMMDLELRILNGEEGIRQLKERK